jgi:hypothetical protein
MAGEIELELIPQVSSPRLAKGKTDWVGHCVLGSGMGEIKILGQAH